MEKNILQNRVDLFYNLLILLIGSTFFIRELSTILIIVFLVFSFVFKRQLQFSKESKVLVFLISSLFLIELLFLWNSSDLKLALKSLEKYLSLLILPVFIVGNYKVVRYNFILENYAKITLLLTAFFISRFLYIESDKVTLYLDGINLWEAGYVLTESFNNHAPNVNLHLAFVANIVLYYFIRNFKQRNIWNNILYGIMIVLSAVFVFFVNTRFALVLMFIGFLLNIIYFFFTGKSIAKKIKIYSIALFLLLCVSLIFTIYKVDYFKEKYTTVTFGHLDKVGELDKIENPESTVFNSIVLRLSVWKATIETIENNNKWIGVGAADSEILLFEYYKNTNQFFLYEYKLGVHNQYLEHLLKFGVVGLITLLCYLLLPLYLGIKTKNVLILIFFTILFLANFFDSYLSLFMGIVYSGWMFSLFTVYYLQHKFQLTV